MALTGRPMIIKSPTEFDEIVNNYQIHCIEKEEPFTMVGLAVYAGMTKDALYDYGKREEFFHSYKKASVLAEQWLVNGALGGRYNPAVSIFLLKNNHGYKDKQEVESNNTTKIEYYAPQKDTDA